MAHFTYSIVYFITVSLSWSLSRRHNHCQSVTLRITVTDAFTLSERHNHCQPLSESHSQTQSRSLELQQTWSYNIVVWQIHKTLTRPCCTGGQWLILCAVCVANNVCAWLTFPPELCVCKLYLCVSFLIPPVIIPSRRFSHSLFIFSIFPIQVVLCLDR